MASEWEELEKLSKDELIIELVRARWRFRNLQKVILDLSEKMGSDCLFEPGQKPSEKWGRKIADYAFRDGPENLCDWGVDEDKAYELFDERFDADDVFGAEDDEAVDPKTSEDENPRHRSDPAGTSVIFSVTGLSGTCSEVEMA